MTRAELLIAFEDIGWGSSHHELRSGDLRECRYVTGYSVFSYAMDKYHLWAAVDNLMEREVRYVA